MFKHVQVESNRGTMKVYGNATNVQHVRWRLKQKQTACDYNEHKGTSENVILAITPRVKQEGNTAGTFQGQYGLASVNQMRDGYEMLKMDIIGVLGDMGFKIVSTVFDPQSGAEKHMMVYSHE